MFGSTATAAVNELLQDVIGVKSSLRTVQATDAGLKMLSPLYPVPLLQVPEEAMTPPKGALQLCEKADGELFVCEITIGVDKHLYTGWSYYTCLCMDVTEQVPVASLLAASQSEESLRQIIGRFSELVEQRPAFHSLESQEYLRGTAMKMWQSSLSDMLGPKGKGSHSMEAASFCSGSTRTGTSGRSLRSTGSSTASWSSHYSNSTSTDKRKAFKSDLEKVPECTLPKEQVANHFSGSFHLGALLGKMVNEERQHREVFAGRFLDQLEEVDNIHRSNEEQTQLVHLNDIMSIFRLPELCEVSFPMAIVHPLPPGRPIVLCSAGMSNLTGCGPRLLGRSCNVLLDGIIDHETKKQTMALCAAASAGKYYVGEDGRHGMAMLGGKLWQTLPDGELLYVHTNLRQSGQLFRCMTHLKQVELDDVMYVLVLQAHIADPVFDPEEHDRGDSDVTGSPLTYLLSQRQLGKQMDCAISLLASKFWFAGSMRR